MSEFEMGILVGVMLSVFVQAILFALFPPRPTKRGEKHGS